MAHGSGNISTPGVEKHKTTAIKYNPKIKSHIDAVLD